MTFEQFEALERKENEVKARYEASKMVCPIDPAEAAQCDSCQ